MKRDYRTAASPALGRDREMLGRGVPVASLT